MDARMLSLYTHVRKLPSNHTERTDYCIARGIYTLQWYDTKMFHSFFSRRCTRVRLHIELAVEKKPANVHECHRFETENIYKLFSVPYVNKIYLFILWPCIMCITRQLFQRFSSLLFCISFPFCRILLLHTLTTFSFTWRAFSYTKIHSTTSDNSWLCVLCI